MRLMLTAAFTSLGLRRSAHRSRLRAMSTVQKVPVLPMPAHPPLVFEGCRCPASCILQLQVGTFQKPTQGMVPDGLLAAA